VLFEGEKTTAENAVCKDNLEALIVTVIVAVRGGIEIFERKSLRREIAITTGDDPRMALLSTRFLGRLLDQITLRIVGPKSCS
jgi:hypothetical protein